MTAPAWALDPWSEEIRFLPVPASAGPVYVFPRPAPPPSFETLFIAGTFETRTTWRREFFSPALGVVFLYVAEEDRDRLLSALQAVERFLFLVALVGGAS